MEENKYLNILNGSPDDEDRKLARRKRKNKARITAFIILFILIAILAGGIAFLVKLISDRTAVKPSTEEVVTSTTVDSEDVSEVLDSLVGSEDEVVVLTPEEVVTEPDPEELYDEWISEKISELTLEEKVLGLFIVTPEELTGVSNVIRAGDSTKASIEKYPVGGIVYGASNITSKEQFKEMIENTRSYVKYETFYVLNEEIGNTVLAKKLNLSSTKTAAEVGETMDPYSAYTENKIVADYLKEYGINFNVGIVGDVLEQSESDLYMKNRAYGSDPIVVSRMILEAINAYNEDGIFSAIGLFPGQGALTHDPTAQVTSAELTIDDITAKQTPIYQAAVDGRVSAIVVSHEYADQLTSSNLPCSLSKEIYTDILRDSLGFKDTILITDALNKAAVADYYTSEEVCVKALKAGADMVMCPENFEEGYKAVLDAVNSGVISEERINDSLKRVWKIKYRSIYEND